MTTRRANRRAIAATGVASLVAGLVLAASGAVIQPAGAAPSADVTICHATSATSNPYREQSVDESAVYGNHGHGGHTGGVFDFTNPSSNSGWGDIIPPMGEHPGLNWTAAGQAIHAAGCAARAVAHRRARAPTTSDRLDAADDPACTPPAEPDPCTYDNTLTADDPACTPPAEPDPCTYDSTLTADDPACTPPAEPDPCTYDNTLAADDPACTPPAEPDPCTYDNTLDRRRPRLHPTRRTRPLHLRQHRSPPTTPRAPQWSEARRLVRRRRSRRTIPGPPADPCPARRPRRLPARWPHRPWPLRPCRGPVGSWLP